MIAHDTECCPICNGREAKLQLEGFEGWNNPERFKQEIRILLHRLGQPLEHIAGSFLHGEFEVCTCDVCLFLRKKIESIRAQEQELERTARKTARGAI